MIHIVTFITGTALWLGATALLLESHAAWDTQTLLVPVLTLATVVAGVISHHCLSQWKLFSGAGMLALALLGSAICLFGTLGRTADTRDTKHADAMATNRNFAIKNDALNDAKRLANIECQKRGPKCKEWEARVDTLTRELSSLKVVAIDARADAIAEIAHLVLSLDKERVRAVVLVLDPIMLPIFLELGSCLLLAHAFPVSRRRRETKAEFTPPDVNVREGSRTLTRDEALADLLSLKSSGSQQLLAERWGVSEGVVSKWTRTWQAEGAIDRTRDGRRNVVAVIPPSRRLTAR